MATYFKTTDGNLFYTEVAAENHARTLPVDLREIVEVDVTDPSSSTKSDTADKPTNLSRLKKDELVSLAQDKGLEVSEEMTKDQIIEVINSGAKATPNETTENVDEAGDSAEDTQQNQA